MRRRRREMRCCYLCAEGLPPRGPGYRKLVSGEHVVPRALLGPPPRAAHEAWPVKLDVHRDCERKKKQPYDWAPATLARISTSPPSEWPLRGELRRLNLEPTLTRIAEGQPFLPTLSNAAPVLEGVATWIRGMHAALYDEFIPASPRNAVFPPVPAASPEHGIPFLETEQWSWIVRTAVERATSLDKWDGIRAWGGRLRYRCVWFSGPIAGVTTHVCLWCLYISGVSS